MKISNNAGKRIFMIIVLALILAVIISPFVHAAVKDWFRGAGTRRIGTGFSDIQQSFKDNWHVFVGTYLFLFAMLNLLAPKLGLGERADNIIRFAGPLVLILLLNFSETTAGNTKRYIDAATGNVFLLFVSAIIYVVLATFISYEKMKGEPGDFLSVFWPIPVWLSLSLFRLDSMRRVLQRNPPAIILILALSIAVMLWGGLFLRKLLFGISMSGGEGGWEDKKSKEESRKAKKLTKAAEARVDKAAELAQQIEDIKDKIKEKFHELSDNAYDEPKREKIIGEIESLKRELDQKEEEWRRIQPDFKNLARQIGRIPIDDSALEDEVKSYADRRRLNETEFGISTMRLFTLYQQLKRNFEGQLGQGEQKKLFVYFEEIKKNKFKYIIDHLGNISEEIKKDAEKRLGAKTSVKNLYEHLTEWLSETETIRKDAQALGVDIEKKELESSKTLRETGETSAAAANEQQQISMEMADGSKWLQMFIAAMMNQKNNPAYLINLSKNAVTGLEGGFSNTIKRLRANSESAKNELKALQIQIRYMAKMEQELNRKIAQLEKKRKKTFKSRKKRKEESGKSEGKEKRLKKAKPMKAPKVPKAA